MVLLTDGEFTVIGQTTTTAATGEVVGQLGAGVLVMRQIDSSETVTVGDEVVTAGIELGGGVRSPYPKGLLLGQVIDVRRDANDVVQTAYLQPAADLDKLEYVLVITSLRGRPAADRAAADRLQQARRDAAAGRAAVLQPTRREPVAEHRRRPPRPRRRATGRLLPFAR